MTITLRGAKGSELTYTELDGNFTDIDTRLTIVEGDYLDSAEAIQLIDSAYVNARASINVSVQIDKFYYTSTNQQVIFTGADDNGSTLNYDSAACQVYLNGMLLQDTVDYTLQATNVNPQVTLATPLVSGHLVTVTNTKLV